MSVGYFYDVGYRVTKKVIHFISNDEGNCHYGNDNGSNINFGYVVSSLNKLKFSCVRSFYVQLRYHLG